MKNGTLGVAVAVVLGAACAPTRPQQTEFELTYYYLKF